MDVLPTFILKPLAVLFVLSVVIFVHELGHFLVARWCGVRVKTFSLGFGREIFGFTDRYHTRWRIAWIPLGGYVKFVDDENSASVPSRETLQRMSAAEREGAFQTKPLAARAAIVAAGPIANFLLAILVFALTFTFVGVNVTAPRVDELVPDSAAARAGFKSGDVIVGIDGQSDRVLRRHAAHRQRQRRSRAELPDRPQRQQYRHQGDAGTSRDLRPVRQ